jgi:hypothetical protein
MLAKLARGPPFLGITILRTKERQSSKSGAPPSHAHSPDNDDSIIEQIQWWRACNKPMGDSVKLK